MEERAMIAMPEGEDEELALAGQTNCVPLIRAYL